MDTAASALPVLAILFLSAFARSMLGFGNALIAMPLLALVVSVQLASPLVALANFATSLTMLLTSRRSIDFRAAWRLLIASLVGMPIGLLFLKTAHESTVKTILGFLLVLIGAYNLIAPKLPKLQSDRPAYAFGLVAGILGGAYNTNGPPVVIYGTLRGWSPQSFRATLQCVFFPTNLMILVGHGLTGLWTPTVLRLFAFGLPLMLLAIYVGGRLNRLVPRGQFNRVVYAFLAVIGLLLVIRA
jgi:uncharacterized membrane protein YfcA